MGFARAVVLSLIVIGLAGAATQAALIGSPIHVKGTGCWWPSVCYNAHSDQYLVFWGDYNVFPQVRARRVDANTGALLGSEFVVSNWPDTYRTYVGDAVYNSANREWFLVYVCCLTDQPEDIYGQRIDSAGNQIGSAIPLCTDAGYQNQPAVAFDSANNRYLVTWTDWTGERKIRGRLFDGYGSPVGSPIQASDTSIFKKSNSSCAYNPVSREFLVTWADDRNWNGIGNNNDWQDVYAQRISASTGALVGANFMVCGPEGSPYVGDGMDGAEVVCNSQNGRYFLAVTRLQPVGAQVGGWVTKGRILNSDGAPCTALFDVSYPDVGYCVGAAYNPVEGSFVMSYIDADKDIAIQRFTSGGAALGSPYKVFNDNFEENFGWLDVRPSDGQMMQVTVWFEDLTTGTRYNILKAQRFDVSGIPVAPVGGFSVRSPNQQNTLTWTNPVDPVFTGTLIRCKTSGYPTSPTDGDLVVDKPGTPGVGGTYAHRGLTNGTAYYYTAWAHDAGPVYSAPRHGWGVPSPSLCFQDAFSYPDGNLNGNGSWSGMATAQIVVSSQAVRINGDTATYGSATTAACSGGGSGIIWMRAKIRQGVGDKTLWSLRVNDTSGVNLARWYGTGTTARPRMGDSTSVLTPQTLTGGGSWDVIEVRIYTGTDISEFLFNGASIGTLSHAGAGDVVGELRLEVVGNSGTSGHYVELDDLMLGEYDPTLPDPVTNLKAIGGDTQVSLSWTNPTGPNYAGTKILCKTAGYPTSATDGTVVYDGPGTSQVHTGLANGVRYYYSAFTYNAILNYSSAVNAWADAAANATILEAKGLANNETRALRGNIVSATGPGYFYIQDPSELQGMKIVAPDAVSQGQKLDVVGVVLGQGAERYLDCSGNAVVLVDAGPISLDALGTGARSVGGGALNSYTPGVIGGVGVNNIGLLMRVWGKVTQRNTSAPQYFYIDDGSGLKDGTQTAGVDNVGIRILANPTGYPTGSYVIVTGAASTFNSGGLRPQILPQAGAIRTVVAF